MTGTKLRIFGGTFCRKTNGRGVHLVPFKFRLLVLIVTTTLFFPGISLGEDAGGGAPAFKAFFDKSRVRVGEVALLTLQYSLPAGCRVQKDPSIEGLDDLTVLGREIAPGRITYRILADRLTPVKVGPLSLAFQDGSGETRTLKSGEIALSILSNLGPHPEEARLRPIEDIIPAGGAWRNHLLWGALLAGVLLAGAGVFLFLRRRKTQAPVAREDPPHVRAKKAIEALEAERMFELGQVKPFYFHFSEILKRYLEALRGFPAAELTTEEISERIKEEEDRRLLYLLRSADFVKFADAMPSQAKKEQEVREALLFIEASSPLESRESAVKDGGTET